MGDDKDERKKFEELKSLQRKFQQIQKINYLINKKKQKDITESDFHNVSEEIPQSENKFTTEENIILEQTKLKYQRV